MSDLPPGGERHSLVPPDASRQIGFYQFLVAARRTWLSDALVAALSEVDPVALKRELGELVPADAQQLLAVAGIRDEQVFPAPALIQAAPSLVGYYRLLLGAPRKQFYDRAGGLAVFKVCEERGIIGEVQRGLLPEFCRAMCGQLAELVRQLSPSPTLRDIAELPLLTLGQMLQGRHNNTIGTQAKDLLFVALDDLVEKHIVARSTDRITVSNSAGRPVVIIQAADPDISIIEEFDDQTENHVAIEIKGGTDRSNAYNRAGEAEKSHLAAKRAGFREFWTIIATRGIDLDKLHSSSTTTHRWFDVTQVLARSGPDWDEFRRMVSARVGIPLR